MFFLGLSFIRENLWRLEDNGLDDWMLAGFEITFPQLLEMAKDLGLDLPYDEPTLQDVYAKRDLKLARSNKHLPIDLFHCKIHTAVHSLTINY